jgi:alkanesulfonate monooxygenase SsuD/methylene tetrahydromethanopterin reductase-like flavin-dependent oxidoreductase (luciferase family)
MRFTLSTGPCAPEQYAPLARAAEACGWDSIAVPDELFYYEQVSLAYPYSVDGKRPWSADTPFLDPFIAIATMAAATERICFYPFVLKLAVRDPLLIAKQLSSLAAVSGERIALGVGLSPWPEDFDVLGQEWAQRGPRSAEMIEVIRGLLQGGMYAFDGQFYHVPRMQLSPVPRNPVPIYIGGLAEPVLKRAARLADGYIGWENPRCALRDVPALFGRLRAYRKDYDRDHLPFEIKFLTRSKELAVAEQLRDMGATDLICTPWPGVFSASTTLAERIDALKRYADHVIARIR